MRSNEEKNICVPERKTGQNGKPKLKNITGKNKLNNTGIYLDCDDDMMNQQFTKLPHTHDLVVNYYFLCSEKQRKSVRSS